MNQYVAKKFIRSPSGAVLIGLVSALILGSFATAGLNTLWAARAMVAISALVVSVYVFRSSLTARWKVETKTFIVVGVLAAHFAIERLQTWVQPPPTKLRSMPSPPLMLMMPPLKLGYSHPQVEVPGLPLAVTYLNRPIGGFAGFGKVGENELDDVMFAIVGVELRNLSNGPLRLSWSLTVRGEGKRFVLQGSGKGRWERQLNVNDYFATSNPPRLRWLLSPIELPPQGGTPLTSKIGFVAPDADKDLRDLILQRELPAEYTATLIVKDEDTGALAELPLPFGANPTPANDPVSRYLREATE